MFPDGRWTEGGDASDISVPAGKWVTIKVPLHHTPAGYWRDEEVTEQDLSRIQRWGIKIYGLQTEAASEPVNIRVRNPRVTAAEAPVVNVPESRGWMMSGERTSYGWIVTDNGLIGGKTVGIEGIRASAVMISWYDTTAGTFVSRIELPVQNGAVTLKVPELKRNDVAFTMKLN
ncbi:hypothetical protein AB6A23_19970 [Paenibacillus tarimensis]